MRIHCTEEIHQNGGPGRFLLARAGGEARVLGPAPLSILKINNNYRYRVTLCAPPGKGLRRAVADAVLMAGDGKLFKGVNVYADTNPSN